MVRPQVHEACTRTLTLCAALAWLIGGAACYPETVGPDDDDDDTTAADDDDTTPSADDDDDTAPFGDQDHDGYTPEDDYKGPGGFLAYVYMILAFAFVLAPAFKNAKRTHLD